MAAKQAELGVVVAAGGPGKELAGWVSVDDDCLVVGMSDALPDLLMKLDQSAEDYLQAKEE
jgi:hypothetical protein